MTGYPFWKMTGAGNDFILMDHREIPWEDCKDRLPEITRALCRRRMSVGADGLIVIVPPKDPKNTFAWDFHNADGSVAEMCGNGARCAARFAYLKGIAKSEELRFETLAGIISARIQGDRVLLGMGDAWDIRKDITAQVGGDSFVMTHVNTGVPHVVCFVDDADAVDLESLGRSLRYHDTFKPAGTNVNFVHMMEGGKIRMRTYERGVEGETLACGTGAAASAVAAHIKGLITLPVAVVTSSGRELRISFENNSDSYLRIEMEGDASRVYEGVLMPEAFDK